MCTQITCQNKINVLTFLFCFFICKVICMWWKRFYRPIRDGFCDYCACASSHFVANQHTNVTNFWNRPSRRWLVDNLRWQTKCSAASWSALKACETSCAYSSLKKCYRATEWKRSEIYHFSRSVSSLHSWDTLQMDYQSLRNVAMHFKAFKCVERCMINVWGCMNIHIKIWHIYVAPLYNFHFTLQQ